MSDSVGCDLSEDDLVYHYLASISCECVGEYNLSPLIAAADKAVKPANIDYPSTFIEAKKMMVKFASARKGMSDQPAAKKAKAVAAAVTPAAHAADQAEGDRNELLRYIFLCSFCKAKHRGGAEGCFHCRR